MMASTGNTRTNDPDQQDIGVSDGGYHFNDPHFVGWWLDSLYLLSIDEQVAVAERLRERVGILDVQATIDVFIDDRTGSTSHIGSPEAPGFALEGAGEVVAMPAAGVAVDTMRRMWTERRPLLIFLGLIVGIYAVRGCLFLFDCIKALVTG